MRSRRNAKQQTSHDRHSIRGQLTDGHLVQRGPTERAPCLSVVLGPSLRTSNDAVVLLAKGFFRITRDQEKSGISVALPLFEHPIPRDDEQARCRAQEINLRSPAVP